MQDQEIRRLSADNRKWKQEVLEGAVFYNWNPTES